MNKISILKQSTANAIFYYLRATIEAFNLLWLFPLILNSEQIGLYQAVTSSAYLIAYLTQLGIPQGIIKYLPRFQQHRKSFLGFILTFTLAIFSIFTVLAILFNNKFANLFKKRASQVIDHFYLILGIAFFLLLMMVLKAWYKSLLRSTIPTFIQNVLVFFSISVSGSLYYFKIIDFDTLMFSIFLIYFSCFLIMFFHLLYIGEMKVSLNFSSLKLSSFFRKFIFYNFCTMVGLNGFSIVTKIDAIMISSIIGLKFNGIYAIVVSIPKLVEIPRKALKQLTMPLISNHINNQEWDLIKTIYKKMSLNQLIAGMFLFVLIFINIDFIFNLIPNKEIRESGKVVIFFLSMTKLIDSSMSIGNDIMLMSKYYWFNIISLILLAFSAISLNIIMIPIWKISGAAAATSLAFFIYNLSIFLFIWIKTKLYPFSIEMVKVILIGLLTYFSFNLLPIFKNDILNIFLRILIFIPYYLFLLYIFKVSSDFNLLLIRLLKKIYRSK
ncbi:MAG: oligosaccharide flippase family protein [Bacteroidetes bacterium]|nr:oligosaccharide flippase family protein [Bacteroidota bacterium]